MWETADPSRIPLRAERTRYTTIPLSRAAGSPVASAAAATDGCAHRHQGAVLALHPPARALDLSARAHGHRSLSHDAKSWLPGSYCVCRATAAAASYASGAVRIDGHAVVIRGVERSPVRMPSSMMSTRSPPRPADDGPAGAGAEAAVGDARLVLERLADGGRRLPGDLERVDGGDRVELLPRRRVADRRRRDRHLLRAPARD